MDKPVKVNQLMAYRVHKAAYKQDRKCKCLVCNRPFEDCVHSWGQVESVINQVKTGIALGIFTTRKEDIR